MSSFSPFTRSVQRLVAQAVGKNQPDLVGLIHAWPEVVGPEWAARATPTQWTMPRQKNAASATLTLAVAPGDLLIVQHECDRLLQRINGFLGHRAVEKLLIKRVDALQSVKKNQRTADSIPIFVEGIEDDGLSLALGKLGASLKGKT